MAQYKYEVHFVITDGQRDRDINTEYVYDHQVSDRELLERADHEANFEHGPDDSLVENSFEVVKRIVE